MTNTYHLSNNILHTGSITRMELRATPGSLRKPKASKPRNLFSMPKPDFQKTLTFGANSHGLKRDPLWLRTAMELKRPTCQTVV